MQWTFHTVKVSSRWFRWSRVRAQRNSSDKIARSAQLACCGWVRRGDALVASAAQDVREVVREVVRAIIGAVVSDDPVDLADAVRGENARAQWAKPIAV